MQKDNFKRVLMLPSGYPTPENPDSGNFYREQARAISINNFVYVVSVWGIAFKYFKKKVRLIEIDSVKSDNLTEILIRYPIISSKNNILIKNILVFVFSLFLLVRLRFDLIHAHKVFPAGFIAVLLGRIYRIPVCITEHSGNFKNVLRNRIRRFSVKYAFLHSKKIIAVSQSLRKELLDYNRKLKIEMVPNTVDIRKFKPKKINHRNHRILHVSSLLPVKGLFYLIEAARIVSNFRNDFVIDVIGGNQDDILRWKHLARKMEVQDKFIFHGKMKNVNVVDYFKSCSFFVFPSIKESFGVVLIEAMACGKPVIATRCGGPEEIVVEGTGILIPPTDSEYLAKEINKMLDNYKAYNNEYISNYIKEKFSYEAFNNLTNRIYSNILES